MPTLVAFFGAETAAQARATRGSAPSSSSATTSSRRFPISTTSSRGVKILLRDDGTATFEFPHLLRLLDGLAVRHDLPRALLVLLARDDRRDLRAHGLEVYDVEELLDARRLAARLRAARRRAARGRRRGRRAARARGGGPGCARRERYARFAEDVKESKRALLDLLIAPPA